MKIAMLSTGDEVLNGDIIDTNAAWLAHRLLEAGHVMQQRATCGDALEKLVEQFEQLSQQVDLVIVNGGLGPTSDDLSADAAAIALGEKLVLCEEWLAKMLQKYQKQGRVMPECNVSQAMLPESAVMIDNPIGTACGFVIELNGATLVFTPGVPSEFHRMVNDIIIPRYIGTAQNHKVTYFTTFGRSESSLNQDLSKFTLPEGVELGYRSSMPIIDIKVIGDGSDGYQSMVSQIRSQLSPWIIHERDSADTESSQEGKFAYVSDIVKSLNARGLRLSIAESCTGGMVAAELVGQPGASDCLDRGYVTYSNQAKHDDLGVSLTTLEEEGAVSMATAREMAIGAKNRARTNIGLSVTGIAGPDGGSDDKPVGTVVFALAVDSEIWIQRVVFSQRGRMMIRTMAMTLALDMLRRYLAGDDVICEYETINRVDLSLS